MATAQEPARVATHPSQLAQALELQRRAFAVDPDPAPAERRERLARLARMLRRNAAGIRDVNTWNKASWSISAEWIAMITGRSIWITPNLVGSGT